MKSSESRKSGSRESGRGGGGGDSGGGIPRPQVVTNSPSKLAIRTNTKMLLANTGKHDPLSRTFSGGGGGGGGEQQQQQQIPAPPTTNKSAGHPAAADPSYRYGPAHQNHGTYAKGTQKALVSDKLYPRIPNPQPLYHPPSPQRSQTLSMIPSHSSRSKQVNSTSVKPSVPTATVRFGGVETSHSRTGPPPSQSQSQQTMSASGAVVKGIMKSDVSQYQRNAVSNLPNPTASSYPASSHSNLPNPNAAYPSTSSSHSSSAYPATTSSHASSSVAAYPASHAGQFSNGGGGGATVTEHQRKTGPHGPMSYSHGQPPAPSVTHANAGGGGHGGHVMKNGYGGQGQVTTGPASSSTGHGPTTAAGKLSESVYRQPAAAGSHPFGHSSNGHHQGGGHQKNFPVPYSDAGGVSSGGGGGKHPGSSSGSAYPAYKGGSSGPPQQQPPPPPSALRNFQTHFLGGGGPSTGANHHPAHPTPPPYTQPPPPTPASFDVTTSSSSSATPSLRLDGEDLNSLNHSDLCRRLISVKGDLKKLSAENGNIVAELNKKIQDHQTEIRNLKELNHRLSEDNQELRDLCCFLDDDRQKGRKLAREWQRFGRYTASVMRQEVSNYQTKLRDLDGKQQALVKDNLELKELCLYLDEERGGVNGGGGMMLTCSECGGGSGGLPQSSAGVPHLQPRDEGDGSSSSTNNDDSEIMSTGCNLAEELKFVRAREALYNKELGFKSGLNDDVLQYIRSLEDRLGLSSMSSLREEDNHSPEWTARPEAVSNAFKVLNIQERILDKSVDSLDTDTDTDLGEGERAIVREMCNVVWKKLEET